MLDASYESFRATVGSDRGVYVLLQHAIPSAIYFAACAVLTAAERRGWWKAYRIMGENVADPQITASAFRTALISSLVVGPLFFAFILYPIELGVNPAKVASPLPSMWTLLWQVAAANLIEDALVYWGHRALHHPLLYARFHKKHHEFKVTTASAATHASTFETVFTHLLPPLAASMLLQMHAVTYFVYAIGYMFVAVDAHCNFNFPVSLFECALRHSFHHSHNAGNFGVKLPLWDWLCRTDVAYRRSRAKRS